MHYITLGGKQYPIQATAGVLGDLAQQRRDALLDAQDQAEDEADARALEGEARERFIERRKKRADLAFTDDVHTSMALLAALVNAAVARERMLNGRDLTAELPHLPLDERKVALIASLDELNGAENAKAVAEEMGDWYGPGAKKALAGRLTAAAQMILKP